MFAGAAREAVFSKPQVVRRINEQFIPVALKAAQVNNPPRGPEGALYAEIGRSKPVPQGISSLNSAGKVLTWALSFDNDRSVVKFLDHVVARYHDSPDAKSPVVAERFMKFPSRQLPNVDDNGVKLAVPTQHTTLDRCPAKPAIEKGTLVGRIIGRPLDKAGNLLSDTVRQEHYMEARFEIPVAQQEQFIAAMNQANGKRFSLPTSLGRSLVAHAYLGQLDVNPLGIVPGSRNDQQHWQFHAQEISSSGADPGTIRIRIEGESTVQGGQAVTTQRDDGRLWEHSVALQWQGYIDISDGEITRLSLFANGHERLRWGNRRLNLQQEADVEHLMAGHPINLDANVRYGLVAKPCRDSEAED